MRFPERIAPDGVLDKIAVPAKQLFLRQADAVAESKNGSKNKFAVKSPKNSTHQASQARKGAEGGEGSEYATHLEARHAFFRARVLERLAGAGTPGVLLFVPSYFDFLAVRTVLADLAIPHAALSEYTPRGEGDRAKALFASGDVRVLVYSERAHFYFRHRVRGVRDVVFFQLPDHPRFYWEIVNLAGGVGQKEGAGVGVGVGVGVGGQPTVTIVFSKFDALQLRRIVGAKRCKAMLRAETDEFLIA